MPEPEEGTLAIRLGIRDATILNGNTFGFLFVVTNIGQKIGF